jgi:chaperonin cofactor prefoldin
MRPILCRVFASLTFLLVSAFCFAAEPLNVPRAGVPAIDSSLDQFIASAKRQAETGSPEFKQLVAQLDPLRAKQQALLATRRTKEAELARLHSAGSDTKRIATLEQEIAVCRSQLSAVDTQFQVLMSRIQPGPKALPAGLLPTSGSSFTTSVGPVPAAGQASKSRGPVPVGGFNSASSGPVAVAIPTPGLPIRTVPPDKIKTAADALARNPAPSAAAARTAASQILSVNQPGPTSVEIDHLARLILNLASQTNAAALNAEITAGKQANEKKSGLSAADQSGQAIKFEIHVPSSGDPKSRLQELQTRQTKLEQAMLELMKMSTAAPDRTSPVKK